MLALGVATAAAAVTNGPIDLATASSYGVVAATGLSNTGPTTVTGDIGLSPANLSSYTDQSDVTQPSGTVVHAADAEALQAQADLGNAYTVASGLTPTLGGQNQLGGLTLTPGVYNSANALQVTGQLTLDGAGDPNAIWVFQAGTSLTTATDSSVMLVNGANACNVYWQVGSSATIGVRTHFVGSVMALTAITALTNATVSGRLLAENAAVTLDSNVITVPTGCATGTTITSSTLSSAVEGTPYSTTLPVSGTPAPTVTLASGNLPDGLVLSSTGTISGTPTTPETTTFTVSAVNGFGSAAVGTYTLTVSSALAATGVDARPGATLGAGLLLVGVLVYAAARLRRHGRHRVS